MSDVVAALLLTLLAGLATGVGGLIAVVAKAGSIRFLTGCLSLSAGVMIYITFVEILGHAQEDLEAAWGAGGYAAATAIFFAGIGLAAVVDRLVPHEHRPGELAGEAPPIPALRDGDVGLHRTGLMAALAISLHNLPEGLVVFVAAMADPSLGLATAMAIALHNVPEGIATAAPIYHVTGSRA